jgi:hypothetical protein
MKATRSPNQAINSINPDAKQTIALNDNKLVAVNKLDITNELFNSTNLSQEKTSNVKNTLGSTDAISNRYYIIYNILYNIDFLHKNKQRHKVDKTIKCHHHSLLAL